MADYAALVRAMRCSVRRPNGSRGEFNAWPQFSSQEALNAIHQHRPGGVGEHLVSAGGDLIPHVGEAEFVHGPKQGVPRIPPRWIRIEYLAQRFYDRSSHEARVALRRLSYALKRCYKGFTAVHIEASANSGHCVGLPDFQFPTI
jgi:hypothetical protein